MARSSPPPRTALRTAKLLVERLIAPSLSDAERDTVYTLLKQQITLLPRNTIIDDLFPLWAFERGELAEALKKNIDLREQCVALERTIAQLRAEAAAGGGNAAGGASQAKRDYLVWSQAEDDWLAAAHAKVFRPGMDRIAKSRATAKLIEEFFAHFASSQRSEHSVAVRISRMTLKS